MAAIVSRSDWGARPPAEPLTPIATPTPRLWVHHTGTEQHGAQGVRDIQRYHQQTKGWKDIAYSFLVDDDGTIYEGRGVGKAGGHTEGDNSRSHAICLMGNFDNRAPTLAAMESLIWLAQRGAELGWWTPTLGGHRDAPGASTACPGRHLYNLLSTVRQRVAAQPQEDDVNADQDRRIKETLTLVRGLAGVEVDDEVAEAVAPGGDARPHLKTLFIGALGHGLRKPPEGRDPEPGEGDLRPVFFDLLDEWESRKAPEVPDASPPS